MYYSSPNLKEITNPTIPTIKDNNILKIGTPLV